MRSFARSNQKNGMGGECSMYGEGEEHMGVWYGGLVVRDILEDLGVEGRMILK